MTIYGEYVAAQCETFDQISNLLYGNTDHVCELLMANPKYSDKVIMDGGEVLMIPQVYEQSESVSVNAPWKEGLE